MNQIHSKHVGIKQEGDSPWRWGDRKEHENQMHDVEQVHLSALVVHVSAKYEGTWIEFYFNQ
jgi:hypothetical protein